jgi:histidinol dehydrogenase
VRPESVRVPAARLAEALAELDPAVRVALEVAIDRTRAVHADQRRTDTTTTLAPGATVTERWVPVERVGLYVPGGNAVYPSSVVMNVVPAQTAGVESLVIASPPQAQPGPFDGLPHPTILAAAALLASTRSGPSAARRRWRCWPTEAPTPTELGQAERREVVPNSPRST